MIFKSDWFCTKLQLIFCALLLFGVDTIAQVKPTPVEERLSSFAKRKELERKSLLKDISFRSIGPSVMSGRVVDVEVNPDDPTEFYVAYASGGLWHTKNNGQSFTPVFDSLDILTIGDIAVNWKSKTIWVGTGEVNSSRSSYAGVGVYKSNNNGKTWDYLGLPESQHIGKILLHPTDNNIAWVAVLGHLYSPNKERGVYKTIDGGKTWKQVLYIDDNTGAIDLDINPQNANELYASMWYRTRSAWNFVESGSTSGIYKSNDGGNNWQLMTKPGAGFPTGDHIGRIGVAVCQKDPGIVYAVVDNNFHRPDTAKKKTDTSKYVLKDFENISKEEFEKLDNNKLDSFLKKNRFPAKDTAQAVKKLVRENKIRPTAIHDYLFDANEALFNTPIVGCEVYRSDNGGVSWKKMNQKGMSLYNTYGYYFGKVFVSPTNDDKIIITGFDIELSNDGGKTFKVIDKGNTHADYHVCWIDPKRDDHFIIGNDGGCNITYDDGAHWFKANSPSVGQFYSVTVDDAKPYNVYGGLQDNGVWWGPSTNKESDYWHASGAYPYKAVNGGDGMQVQVDTRDNNTVYSGSQFGFYSRNKKSDTQEDDDLPETAENNNAAAVDVGTATNNDDDKPLFIHPQNDLGQTQFRFNWQTPILLSRHNQDVFYFGSNKFHRSLHKGENLEALSEDLTNGKKEGNVPYGTITTLTESPLKFGLIYAGTDDGNIQMSKDGGYTWTLVSKALQKSEKLPAGLWVSRVVASQHKEGRVYATLSGYRNDNFKAYVFVSDDYGATWRSICKDLPMEPVNIIREDPKYDSILYVGTDGGLYVSIDAGNGFMQWDAGLPRSVPIHDIAIQQRENEIVLGTHGRSLYVAKLDSVQVLLKNPDFLQKKKLALNRSSVIITAERNAAKKIDD